MVDNNNNNVESNSTLAKVGNAALEFVGEIKRLETLRNNYLSIYFLLSICHTLTKKSLGKEQDITINMYLKEFFCIYS